MLGSMENTSGGNSLCLDCQLITCALTLSQKPVNRNTLKGCSEHGSDGSLLPVGSCSSVQAAESYRIELFAVNVPVT